MEPTQDILMLLGFALILVSVAIEENLPRTVALCETFYEESRNLAESVESKGHFQE